MGIGFFIWKGSGFRRSVFFLGRRHRADIEDQTAQGIDPFVLDAYAALAYTVVGLRQTGIRQIAEEGIHGDIVILGIVGQADISQFSLVFSYKVWYNTLV